MLPDSQLFSQNHCGQTKKFSGDTTFTVGDVCRNGALAECNLSNDQKKGYNLFLSVSLAQDTCIPITWECIENELGRDNCNWTLFLCVIVLINKVNEPRRNDWKLILLMCIAVFMKYCVERSTGSFCRSFVWNDYPANQNQRVYIANQIWK